MENHPRLQAKKRKEETLICSDTSLSEQFDGESVLQHGKEIRRYHEDDVVYILLFSNYANWNYYFSSWADWLLLH